MGSSGNQAGWHDLANRSRLAFSALDGAAAIRKIRGCKSHSRADHRGDGDPPFLRADIFLSIGRFRHRCRIPTGCRVVAGLGLRAAHGPRSGRCPHRDNFRIESDLLLFRAAAGIGYPLPFCGGKPGCLLGGGRAHRGQFLPRGDQPQDAAAPVQGSVRCGSGAFADGKGQSRTDRRAQECSAPGGV